MSQTIVRRISGSLCKAVLSCRIRRVYLSRSWGCGYWRWGRFLWYFGILFGTWVIGLARGIFHKMTLFPVHHHWYKQEKEFLRDTKEGPPSGNNLNKWPSASVNYVSDREGRSRFFTATFMCSILRTSARRGFATNGGSSSNVDKLEEAFKYSGLADHTL